MPANEEPHTKAYAEGTDTVHMCGDLRFLTLPPHAAWLLIIEAMNIRANTGNFFKKEATLGSSVEIILINIKL